MRNVFSFLYESAMKFPEKIFVMDQGTEWTYREVYRRTAGLAGHIMGYGIRPGDRVLICLDNSVEYIAAFFSVFLANAIAVPVNKSTSPENIRFVVKDMSPALVLSSSLFIDRVLGKLDIDPARMVKVDGVLRTLPQEDIRETELLSGLSQDSSLPAMILYTSGTTRSPKGVTLTHQNLLANTASILQYLRLTAEDSVLATINFSYSYGNSLLLTHTCAGGALVIENRVAYPLTILEQLYLSRVTGFSTVGSYLNILLKQNALQECHLKHLRYMTFAGEGTNYEDIVKLNRLAPHLRIFIMYGQTEAAARLSYLEPELIFEKPRSIGKGIPGVTLRVVNEEGRDVEPGETGEIIACGDNIMRGYWNNEAETAAAIREGWLYTCDMATVDDDGYIYVKGRKDDVIKYLGHRISPVEVEGVINSFEAILESAVIATEKDGEKRIKAYVVPKAGRLDLEELTAHIRKQLPPFKRPHDIEVVREIPRTSNGKIKRSELRDRNESEPRNMNGRERATCVE